MIYISTGGFNKIQLSRILSLFNENSIENLELSGGLYTKNVYKILSRFKNLRFSLHNYFPVPRKSFVINLASLDQKIAEMSINQLKKSIYLSQKLKSKYYSIHAGFAFDPKIDELGKKIIYKKTYNRKKCFRLFLNRVNYLAKYAKKRGIKLLVENNVVTKKNLINKKNNPLLLCDPKEIILFFKNTSGNVGLLLDLAHLKVSSNTLKFNLRDAHSKLRHLINGYHLSDNKGLKDTNDSFTKTAWFWKIIKKNLDYYSIEVYSKNFFLLKSLKNILQKHIIT
jgi:sugar phosphate isomerase/epimerase